MARVACYLQYRVIDENTSSLRPVAPYIAPMQNMRCEWAHWPLFFCFPLTTLSSTISSGICSCRLYPLPARTEHFYGRKFSVHKISVGIVDRNWGSAATRFRRCPGGACSTLRQKESSPAKSHRAHVREEQIRLRPRFPLTPAASAAAPYPPFAVP